MDLWRPDEMVNDEYDLVARATWRWTPRRYGTWMIRQPHYPYYGLLHWTFDDHYGGSTAGSIGHALSEAILTSPGQSPRVH